MKPNIPFPTWNGWRQKLPSFSQWQKLPALLSQEEKLLVVVLAALFFGSSFQLANALYVANTEVAPSRGGTLVEGMAGHPRFLNPAYSEASDVDRDLARLIYSGLFKYDRNGELKPDLAKDWVTEGEGRIYEVTLREGARWHDGYPFTADDVVFTIETIQDPRYKSPVRANWVGVGAEKISDYRVRFELQSPYTPFLERLTLPILPSHLWNEISPENFALSTYNLKPIGTGPYRLSRISQDEASGTVTDLELRANPSYHGTPANIERFRFRFYDTEEELFNAVQRGEVQSFSAPVSSPSLEELKSRGAFHEFFMPRSFALFFNLEEVTEENVRKALRAALDKEALLENAFEGNAVAVSSPLRPSLLGLAEPEVPEEDALSLLEEEGFRRMDGLIAKPPAPAAEFRSDLAQGAQSSEVRALQECLAKDPDVYPEGTVSGFFGPATKQAVIRFQETHAQEVLAPSGLSRGTGIVGPSTRDKLNALCSEPEGEPVPLTIAITYPERPSFQKAAEEMAHQWEEFGIQIELRSVPPADFERGIVKPRNYQAILFGEILGTIPDPFPFWHSSQKQDPGLNLSAYENSTADSLLEKVRAQMSPQERRALLEEFQNLLIDEAPAIFLYDTPYLYIVPERVRGVEGHLVADPSHRFSEVTEWYIETERVWK